MLVATRKPLRILLSAQASSQHAAAIAACLPQVPYDLILPVSEPIDVDVAFISRDVTGLSTKHAVLSDTLRFYNALLNAPSLRWVHVHSAGLDRPVLLELAARGVQVTASSGANAEVVAHSALAGILALARRLPQLAKAQRRHAWEPLIGGDPPPDLPGQRAVVVGWGAIGKHIARLLSAFGVQVSVVRRSAKLADGAADTVAFEDIGQLLPSAQWLVLACPLTERTRGLIDAATLSLLPSGAYLVNVARGEIVIETALIDALNSARLGGAFLDVFKHEPLPPDSPLWDLANVIVTPHSAGFAAGNAQRVAQLFLDNLGRWIRGEPLHG